MKTTAAFVLGFATVFAFLACITGCAPKPPAESGFCPQYFCAVDDGR